MRARYTRRAFLFLSTISLALPAYAGAWLQQPGRGQIILNNYFYHSDHLYNNRGKREAQPAYHKYEINPYIEYGISPDWTIGANLSFQGARQKQPQSWYLGNYGIGDSELFARTRLWQQGGFVLSAMPLIKLPSFYTKKNAPKIGSDEIDAAFGLSAGYGFSWAGQPHFVDIGTLYRYRFGAPKDRVDVSATLGYSLNQRWILMPQLFFTYRIDAPQNASFTQSSADDYNLTKLQLSVVYKLNMQTSFQAGAFTDVAGKNTGIGNGVLLSVWRHF